MREPNYNLTIQAWDKDIVSSNELIGACELDISALVNDALATGRQMVLNEEYFVEHMQNLLPQQQHAGLDLAVTGSEIDFEDDPGQDRFWVPARSNLENGGLGLSGGILCSITVLPKAMADKYPQGDARQEPNSEPHCPPAEGRIMLAVNPFEMLRQFIPPNLQRQIQVAFCGCAIIALCVMLAPIVLGNIIAKKFTG